MKVRYILIFTALSIIITIAFSVISKNTYANDPLPPTPEAIIPLCVPDINCGWHPPACSSNSHKGRTYHWSYGGTDYGWWRCYRTTHYTCDRAFCEAQGGDPDDPEHWAWLDGCCYDPNYCGVHVYGQTGIVASCLSASCNPQHPACQGNFTLKMQNGWYTGGYLNRDKLSPSINYHLDVLNEVVPDYHWVQGP